MYSNTIGQLQSGTKVNGRRLPVDAISWERMFTKAKLELFADTAAYWTSTIITKFPFINLHKIGRCKLVLNLEIRNKLRSNLTCFILCLSVNESTNIGQIKTCRHRQYSKLHLQE